MTSFENLAVDENIEISQKIPKFRILQINLVYEYNKVCSFSICLPQRLHPEQQSNWERKKAERHGYFTKNSPGNNFSNFYSTFTIPTVSNVPF